MVRLSGVQLLLVSGYNLLPSRYTGLSILNASENFCFYFYYVMALHYSN